MGAVKCCGNSSRASLNAWLCTCLAVLRPCPVQQVVLASSPGLETGFSRQLLVEWASDPKNTICFVQRAKVRPSAKGDGPGSTLDARPPVSSPLLSALASSLLGPPAVPPLLCAEG